MTEETWETIGKSDTLTSGVCVRYHVKYADIKFTDSNIRQELPVLLRKLFTEEDLPPYNPLERNAGRAAIKVHFLIQLSGNKTRLRFVVGKENAPHSVAAKIECVAAKKDAWGDFVVQMNYYERWYINTDTICSRLSSERMVFVDSDGAPTKSPLFELAEEDGKITITASIKGISQEQFLVAFPAKTRKKTAAPTPSP